ncbi:MAG: aminopeptidase P N-terminal domain-containing protein [Bacteroidales bacterium]|nr:aminopeptidase P N-terminal domain-containing protein [Bacteroidales bacterium]
MPTFPKSTYIARRQRLTGTMGSGLLLFLGNNNASMNYRDNGYPFRQDSTFLYLFGLDYEGLAAVIDVDNDRTIVFGDELTIDDIVWTGPQPTLAEKAASVGVTETRPLAELDKYVANAIGQHQPIHFIPQYRCDNMLWMQRLLGVKVGGLAGDAFVQPMEVAEPSLQLCYELADMLNHKSDEELVESARAIDITVEMHETAMRIVRPGMHERDINAAVMQVALAKGYFYSFPTIATSHGQTLHNHGYIHTLRDGDMLLLDAGAESESHYAGDCTTTMPVGRDYTPRQREVYDILYHTYEEATRMIRPGVTYTECHVQAWANIAEGLKQLGIMKGDPKEAANAGAVALFMPHGLGHMMGLDVHDMENYGEVYVGYPRGVQKDTRFGFAALRLGRALEPGFVFTVEPGIYFIPELIDQWRAAGKFREFINYDKLEAFRDFGGIRNEEDWLITADGARRIGRKKPGSVEEILAMKG